MGTVWSSSHKNCDTMNDTVSILSEATVSLETIQLVAVYLHFAVACATAAELALFSAFVLAWDHASDTHRIATPTNIALFVTLASVTAEETATAVGLSKSKKLSDEKTEQFIADLFFITCEFFYILYSWQRSEKIIKSSFPELYTFFSWLIRLSPFILYLQIIPSIAKFIANDPAHSRIITALNWGFKILGGVVILACDIMFVGSFVRFLSRTRDPEDESIQPDFKIIAQDGIFACLLILITLVLYLAGTLMSRIEIRNLLTACCGVSMFSLATVLLVMKIQLHMLRRKTRLEHSRTRVTKVKQTDDSLPYKLSSQLGVFSR
ncbi:hypothetical protein BJ741DRAFT_625155 [Chytriomyces cf. hyalinus JEL632]|nr:hypothetical protein BJ741DRAFT_625155 [Chytriomyces cf. hyalinus JEL632]